MAGLSSRRCGFESRWDDFGPLDKRKSRVPLKHEEQVRFLLWRLMSEWRNGRRGILKISFLRVRIPLPTLCRCIRKAQEPALEAGGEQLAGSNPAAGTTKKEGNDPSFSYVFNYVRQTGFRCNCIHGSGCHIFRQA